MNAAGTFVLLRLFAPSVADIRTAFTALARHIRPISPMHQGLTAMRTKKGGRIRPTMLDWAVDCRIRSDLPSRYSLTEKTSLSSVGEVGNNRASLLDWVAAAQPLAGSILEIADAKPLLPLQAEFSGVCLLPGSPSKPTALQNGYVDSTYKNSTHSDCVDRDEPRNNLACIHPWKYWFGDPSRRPIGTERFPVLVWRRQNWPIRHLLAASLTWIAQGGVLIAEIATDRQHLRRVLSDAGWKLCRLSTGTDRCLFSSRPI